MNPSFIILETKIVDGRLLVYGGLVWHGEESLRTVATFAWYTLAEFTGV